jgi:hypothetical protein
MMMVSLSTCKRDFEAGDVVKVRNGTYFFQSKKNHALA